MSRAVGAAGAITATTDAFEAELLARVLDALLREDAYGLRSRARTVRRRDGEWLRVVLTDGGGVLLPVEPDGFQCEIRVRRPARLLVEGEPDGTALTTLAAILARLRHAADPDDRGLYDAFVVECRRTLDAMRLHARTRPRVVERLIAAYGGAPAEQWAGVRGSLAYDTLAAFRDHPVYPTGRTRLALSDAEQHAHAPEFHPSFRLRWVALPREVVAGEPARLPAWWPTPGALGLPYGHGLDDSHLAFPVHPLSAPRALAVALRATRLTDRAHLADAPWLDVRPTLSMRTVAVTDDPLTHLKLPLATATLGARNRRTIKPGTLADGDAGQRLTEAVLAREPRPAGGVLLADEGTYLHAGHEFLATLVRRYPPGLDGCQVVPLAALLSPAPGDPRNLVADALAARYYGGDLFALLDAYLTLLFDVHSILFAYGVALESHQQNTSLVLDTEHGRPRLRLLLKDHDGPRVHPARLAGAVGGDEAARLLGGFDDRRIPTDGDGPVADVFATITVHLCAGALAFELARLGRAPLDTLLRLIRDRLAEAIDRLGDHRPGAPGAVLRALVLDADRLPVKAMVTAGSLFTKQRSGAADINKHYVTGPNYLLPAHGR